MRFGSLTLKSNLFLSPLAGYTNLPFRIALREIGGLDLATTDLVNARSLLEKNRKALKLIETNAADQPLAVQLFGSVPEEMRDAALMLESLGVASVDIALSRDGGVTYPEALATGIANTGTFNWTVSGPATTTAIIQVVAHDVVCSSGRDTSNAVFQIGSPVGVGTDGRITEFGLASVRPNPTSGATRIVYQLPREAQVKLSILNVQGREVAVLLSGRVSAGRYEANWSGATGHGTAAAGIYFVRYEAGDRQFTRRLVVLR